MYTVCIFEYIFCSALQHSMAAIWQVKDSLNKHEKQLLAQINEMGYNDEILNILKLIIYKWNINDVINYYNNDSFCHLYCIGKNYNWSYGCNLDHNKCKFEHSFCLEDSIFGTKSEAPNFKYAKQLCQYLIYLNKYNNNAALFWYYGNSIDKTSQGMNDILLAEKLYLKSISIDEKFSNAHNDYAILLHKLKKFDKAEYHYQMVLKLLPNDANYNSNFGGFLIERGKYKESLKYCEKACKLEPNHCRSHYWYGKSLYYLNNYEKSIKEFEMALNLNDKLNTQQTYKKLPQSMVSEAKEYISLMKTSLNERKESANVCLMFYLFETMLINFGD